MGGFGPQDRPTGKWRRFSPADVLRLGIVRSLKVRTQMAISEQGGLLDFIGHKDFILAAVKLWRDGLGPTLVTDLAGFHEVQPQKEVNLGWLVGRGGPLFIALSLDGPMRLTLAAMVKGGSDRQREAAMGVVVRQPEGAKGGDVDGALRYLLAGLSVELGTHQRAKKAMQIQKTAMQVATGIRAMDVRTNEEKRKHERKKR